MTFTVFSFGCKVNIYEAEAIKEDLVNCGYTYVSKLPSDFAIINTCAVTLVAEKKDMEKIRSISNNYPLTKIIVMGCFSQLHPDKILPIENVIAVLGSSKRKEIPSIMESNSPKDLLVEQNSRIFSYEELSVDTFSSSVRAFCKIQDGCDNFCSYCVIPLVRGKSRSRKKEDILLEIKRLNDKGYKEIVLIGIDTGSYLDGETDFTGLVKDILALPNCGFRLRISSIEETQINPELIALMKKEPRLVPHLHIPLQSGSSHILSLMRRKYDLNRFIKLTSTFKDEIPNLALSTDVIVGFPQESEEDFTQTCDFIKKVGFMRTHVFPYSRRPFTSANLMEGQLDQLTKKKRARELIKIGSIEADKYKRSMVGRELVLLIEEELSYENGLHLQRGYTENYLDLTIASGQDLLGKFVLIKLNPDLSVSIEKVL